MDTVVGYPDVAAAALPSFYRPCALAGASVLLAAAGFRLGAPRNITLGGITHSRDRRCRKACLPNFAFRCFGGDSIHRRHAIGRPHAAGYIPYGSSDTHHPCWIPEHAGP